MNAIQHIALLCGIVLLGLGVTPGSAWADAGEKKLWSGIKKQSVPADKKQMRHAILSSIVKNNEQKQLITLNFGGKSAKVDLRQYKIVPSVRTLLAKSLKKYAVSSVRLSKKPVESNNFDYSVTGGNCSARTENRTCLA